MLEPHFQEMRGVPFKSWPKAAAAGLDGRGAWQSLRREFRASRTLLITRGGRRFRNPEIVTSGISSAIFSRSAEAGSSILCGAVEHKIGWIYELMVSWV